MTHFSFCQGQIEIAYLGVHGWVNRWAPDRAADTIAADAVTRLVEYAVVGHATSYGPYRELYDLAEQGLRRWSQGTERIIPFRIWSTIPVPTGDYLSSLAKAYSLIYQGSKLAEVTLEERKICLDMLRGGRFDSALAWAPAHSFAKVPQVRSILGRVSKALETHICGIGHECVEFADVWLDEERRGLRWRAEFLPLHRESMYG